MFVSPYLGTHAVFVGLTEVPIIIKQTDEYIHEAVADPNVTEYRDLGAFKWWFVTLMFNIMFIVMHIASK